MTHAEIITALAKADPAKVRVEWAIARQDGILTAVRYVDGITPREDAEDWNKTGGPYSVVRVLVVEWPEPVA